MSFADGFRAAWRTRDLDAMIALCTPDVVLRSPVITTPFRGPAVGALYRALFDRLPDPEFTGESVLPDGRELILWAMTIDGTHLEGIDIVTLNGDGLATEITVMIRPLVGTAAFLAAIGPDLARHRSRLHAAAMKPIGAGFSANARMTDKVAPRFLPTQPL
jgi:hypothetical protein